MVCKAPSSVPNLLTYSSFPGSLVPSKLQAGYFLWCTHMQEHSHTYIYMHTTYTFMAPPLFYLGVFRHITLPSRPSLLPVQTTHTVSGPMAFGFLSFVLCAWTGNRELVHQQLPLLPCAGFSRDKSLAEPEAPLSGCQGPGALYFRLTVLEWAP